MIKAGFVRKLGTLFKKTMIKQVSLIKLETSFFRKDVPLRNVFRRFFLYLEWVILEGGFETVFAVFVERKCENG